MKTENIQTVYQKIYGIVERGIASMGNIFLMEYRLPETCGLEQFFNSLKITLWRMALAPQYVWWLGSDGCCYLALTVYGGYGRKDVSDIDSVVQRLWHGISPVTLLHWQRLDTINAQFALNAFQTQNLCSLPHHKRSFGGTTR